MNKIKSKSLMIGIVNFTLSILSWLFLTSSFEHRTITYITSLYWILSIIPALIGTFIGLLEIRKERNTQHTVGAILNRGHIVVYLLLVGLYFLLDIGAI